AEDLGPEHHGPREEKHRFYIENKEQDRKQVVANVNLADAATDGQHAAFVGCALGPRRRFGRQQQIADQRDGYERDADEHPDEHRAPIVEYLVHAVRLPPALSIAALSSQSTANY